MGKCVFVSYRHTQGEWVLDRLVPCLKAGGAEVRIDVERFKAGKGIVGQMDAEQDASQINVLVLSDEYFESDYCVHEFERALEKDPAFAGGIVVPVLRDDVDWRRHITFADPPLFVDLRDDRRGRLSQERHKAVVGQWDLLLEACGADLGCDARDWLRARDEVVRLLRRNQSVNLVVHGQPEWERLLVAVRHELESDGGATPGLASVDLEDAETTTRRALVAKVLKECGMPTAVPDDGEELVLLKRTLATRALTRLAFLHFDLVEYHRHYDVPFFAGLRNMIMDHVLEGTARKLAVLIQSRKPFAALLPRDHPLSEIQVTTVELRGRPT